MNQLSKCCNAEIEYRQPMGDAYCSKCGLADPNSPTPPTSTNLTDDGPYPTCANCGFGEWRHKEGFRCKQFVSRDTAPTITEVERQIITFGQIMQRTSPESADKVRSAYRYTTQAITRLIQQAYNDGYRKAKEDNEVC